MFLTATATSSMTETLKGYLDDPTVLKGTMHEPYGHFPGCTGSYRQGACL